MPQEPDDLLLTSAEVAAMFRVRRKTVSNWAAAGKIPALYTPGGHIRIRESDARYALENPPSTQEEL